MLEPVRNPTDWFRRRHKGVYLNCAHAVGIAFGLIHPDDTNALREFRHYGYGKAANGDCGALHAARMVIERHNPELVQDLEERFAQVSGSAHCREIRRTHGRRRCDACVADAVRLLPEVLSQADPESDGTAALPD